METRVNYIDVSILSDCCW